LVGEIKQVLLVDPAKIEESKGMIEGDATKMAEAEEPEKKETNSRVEAIIRRKLGRDFKADDFDESLFDVLLLEGLDLAGELTQDDKAFLERFKHAKCLNMSNCNLRSLKYMPAISGL